VKACVDLITSLIITQHHLQDVTFITKLLFILFALYYSIPQWLNQRGNKTSITTVQ